MSKNDDLFLLIQALTFSEKVYFKTFAREYIKGEKSNAILLFEEIEKMDSYDEGIIKKKFSSHKFVSQLHVTKNYLQNLIYKSMRNYYAEETSLHEIRNLHFDINFSIKKGLYINSEKLIAKAKRLAEENEQFLFLAIFISKEREIYFDNSKQLNIEHIMDLNNQENDALNKYKNLKEFQLNNKLLYSIYLTKRKVRGKTSKEEADTIINKPIFKNEKMALSYKALCNYYNTYGMYFYYNNDTTNAYKYSQKFIQLFESHPEKIKDKPDNYYSELYNIAKCQLSLKKYSEVLKTISKIKDSFLRYKKLPVKLNFRIENLQMSYCIATGKFQEGEKYVNEVKEKLKKEPIDNPLEKMELFYNMAVLYFGNKNHLHSIKTLDSIIDDMGKGKNNEVGSDIYCFSRIVWLINHFELKNNDLLEYAIRTTKLFLQKRKKLYQFETIFLKFLKTTLSKHNNREELRDTFKKLKNELSQLSKDPFEKNIFDYFDFNSWLESKIENRPFAEIIREKAKLYLK